MTRRRDPDSSQRRCDDERGSGLVVGIVMIFAFTFLGLVWLARDVDRGVSNRSAAQSIAFQAARSGAQSAAATELRSGVAVIDPTSCESPSVSVDVSAFRPGGRVAVTVSCTVSAQGLELIDPPSTGATTATAFAAIDPLRATEAAP